MESAQASGSPIALDEIRTAIAGHLGLAPDEIADHADLIQLGLDSIRTMKLAGSWRKRGLAVNFAQLAAEPTVAAWHRLLGGTGDAATADEQPNPLGASLPAATVPAESAPAAGSGPRDAATAHANRGAAASARGAAADDGDAIAGPSMDAANTVVVESNSSAAESRTADGSPVLVDDGSPFALAPMQHAYWIGRSEGQELGAVAAHLYVEFDGAGVDAERLGAAVEALVQRHPMLRTRFLPDGTQQTLDRPGRPVWSVTDLRDAAAAEAERVLEELRDKRTHQLMAVEDGQVVDIALTLLPEGRTRLHLDVDMLAADAMSYRILVADLARLYHGEQLPPQTYTFRRYLADRSGPAPERDADRAWWQQRLPELPGAPELPRATAIIAGSATRGSDATAATGAASNSAAARGAGAVGNSAATAVGTSAPSATSPDRSAAAHAAGSASISAAAEVFTGGGIAEVAPAGATGAERTGSPAAGVGEAGGNAARTVRFHRWLAPEAKARMFAAAHSRGVTPAMALASVFAETIGGWSAQRRFLLNLPLFHREPVHPQVDGVVGDFTSSVLLQVDVTEPATVTERAHALQRELHAAGAHSGYAGLEVLRDLGRQRGEPVLAPIVYTSAINLGELFADRVTDTFGDPVWIISQGPQVLLDAQVTEVRGGLLLNWDVRENAFPAGMVESMFARYIDAVLRLAGTEEAAGGRGGTRDAGWEADAAVRIPVEQAVIRARVNATDGRVSGRTLHAGLFAHARTSPDAPAVIWEQDHPAAPTSGTSPARHPGVLLAGISGSAVDSGQEHARMTGRTSGRAAGSRGDAAPSGSVACVLTYGQLAAEALAVAGALRAAGVRPGDAVAVQLPKGPDQIVATVGALAAGAVYVPIGFDQPAARRAEILRTGGVVAAVTAGAEVPEVRTLALAEARVYPEPLAEPVFPDPEAIAYVLFTSGSTGKPKGVEVPHRAAMNTIDDLNERFEIGAADRALALSALEFDLSVYDIFGLLSAGGAVVALDEAQRGEPARWLELVRQHRVSVLNCVPSLLDMLLTAAAGQDLGSLRMVILGGDWVDVALPGRLAAVAPGCRFAGLGGATETAIHSTICEVVNAEVPKEWSAVPYGTPLRNVRCRVVGPAGHDCPDFVSGELWIGGDGVAAGYRGDAERTADRFVTHEGVNWYRTGDLARYLPDGTLEFLGRVDHQVKIRGYRVELGEVESALRGLPGVRHAVAAVIGSSAPKLTAVVVPVDGVALEVDALLTAAADLLPAYMIPTRVELLAELPFTSNGKPDRKAITALLSAGDQAGEFISPRTDLERALADIVALVLEREQVGVTDDFFALGGDSVLATAVIARVRDWLDSPDAVVSDFFAARTVAGLAQRLLDREQRAGATGRLDAVATLYLEVAAMSDDEVLAHS
ncbi:amino acid adenylation domain-containing protein [Nocardia sp. NPDC127526]|uniref:non-ribosomal peptide synthetase n=1 Tax=Nocardia sp. NPDC127526 TaxID=3345393 RepID=UPI003625421E